MNYQKIYDSLIERARQRELKDVYFEKHHVVPKCLNGSNDKSNIVKLLAREHFVAHELLVKIYPANINLLRAIWYMSNCNKNFIYKISSRHYERIKLRYSFLHSGKNHWNYGNHRPEETLIKISDNHADVSGIKNPMYGKTHREEICMAQSIRAKNYEKKICEKCGKKMNKANYKQYHGDNCGKYPLKYKCQYCNKVVSKHMLTRWHGEKCKIKKEMIK